MSVLPPVPQLLAFLVVAALLTVTPGADMALVMRHTLAHGRRQAFFVSLGICAGTLIWGTISGLGVAVVLAQSVLAFDVLKYAGGAYLLYLGAHAIAGAIRGRSTTKATTNAKEAHSGWMAFAQGIFTNLLNPKVAVFYLTFLPQFVAPNRPVLPQSIFLATTHVAMGLVWLVVYAHFLDRMAAVLLTDRVKRRIEATTGAVLMALGIRLALAKR